MQLEEATQGRRLQDPSQGLVMETARFRGSVATHLSMFYSLYSTLLIPLVIVYYPTLIPVCSSIS